MNVIRGNGGYIIEAMVTSSTRSKSYMRNTWLETQQYIYYTRKEAIQRFKQYLKENDYQLVK